VKAIRYLAAHPGLVAQWFGALAPAGAWTVQFLAAYNLSDTISCSPGAVLAGGAARPWIALISGAALAVTVVAGVISYRCWIRLRSGDPTVGERASWLAVAGMMTSVLFFLIIAASFLPLVLLTPCQPIL
jgi:hypothetical protein